ncbi:PDZ domain-containing protein [Naumannella cuiyingiana]|uniref:endopeptidase La n=1 Tax=Naumannella cuiyingiana TaxID=1347891 RepID=A0A7Z0D6L5_9ACTN|nr:PDZ domain-containing protein [Naumannella cuiyingiana]
MTRQTLTALVSAVLFVGFAVALAVLPVPFVVYSPGGTVDVLGNAADGSPVVELSDVRTYPTDGRLDMTTISVTRADAVVGVPEAMLAHFLPSRETLPRNAVYPQGRTADEVRNDNEAQMGSSQDNALVAATLAAGQEVQDRPMVTAVTPLSPADGQLQPGDLLYEIGGEHVANVDQVSTLVARHRVGDTVPFKVVRAGRELIIPIVLQGANDDPTLPIVGIAVGTGYRLTPQVTYNVDPAIGGPSAGLVFALAIYDKITEGQLLGDRVVAGTGTIDARGNVGPIGGIQEKIAAAEGAGATIFLVPSENCPDVAGVQTSMRLVQVGTLQEAITAVEDLAVPERAAGVPSC